MAQFDGGYGQPQGGFGGDSAFDQPQDGFGASFDESADDDQKVEDLIEW